MNTYHSNTILDPIALLPEIENRYSPFVFKDDPISEQELRSIFEAGRWAPSAKNIQPWHFLYTTRGAEAYEALFNCLSPKNQKWARNAPVFILTAYQTEGTENDENFYALHDLGACTAFMNIQAEKLGIGFHHMGGEEINKAKDCFEVPEQCKVVTILAVGYYGTNVEDLEDDSIRKEAQTPRTRHFIESYVHREQW